VLCPPWKAASPGLVSGYVRLLRRAGYDAWLAVPPRHGDRTPAGVRSGEGFVSPDLPALRSAVEQAVLELRWLAAIARSRGGEVGLLGLSLGGLSAALAATAPEPLDFVALVAPPADLLHVLAATRIGRRYAGLAARAGAPIPGRAALRRMLAPFRPAARHPAASRLFLAAGRHDRVVPLLGPARLARAWGVAPRIYPRGHLTLLFASDALRRDLSAFLAVSASPPGTHPGPA
jgi:dienelactone hydrolase